MSFLRKKSVGLHLSSDAIRLAVLYKKGKQITVGPFHTEPLAEGIIKDGKIRDYQKLKKLLLLLKKKVGFDEINFSFDRPESDLFEEIKIKVLWFEEEAPAAIRAILAKSQISSTKFQTNSKLEIGNWKLGIFPVMLIDIGSDRTIVSVAVNGKINYCEKLQISSRFLKDLIERNWGLDLFTEEINKHYLDWHLKVSKSSPAFAKGYGGRGKPSESSLPRASDLSRGEALREASLRGQPQEGWNLHFLPSDNQDFVKNKGLKINNIILYGSALFYPYQSVKDTCLSVLPEYLMANLKVPVELANVWTNILPSFVDSGRTLGSDRSYFDDKIPSISFNESLGYATAIGLALKGF